MNSKQVSKFFSICLLVLTLVTMVWSPSGAAQSKPLLIGNRTENPGPFLSWPLANTNQDNISRLPDTSWTHQFLGISDCGDYPSLLDPGTWYDGKSYPGNRHLILPGVPDSQVKWMNDGDNGVFNNAFACYNGHEGIDISQANGTAVLAAAPGKVYKISGSRYTLRHENVNGSGQTWYTTYVHVTNMRFPVGTEVNRGDTIASVGSGHLHFEALYNDVWSANARNPYGIDQAPYNGCLWLDAQFCPGVSGSRTIPENQELMRNGSFETYTLEHWWKWGDIAYAFYEASALFFKHNSGGNGGSVGQSFHYDVPVNTPFELRFKLANTSNVTKTPLVSIVSRNNWDVQCRFSLAAGENSLREYVMRGVNHSFWDEFNVQISPDPIDGIPDLVLDDVSLVVRPNAGITATECIAPGVKDTTPPGGNITYPTNGVVITNRFIELAADAWDNPGGSGVNKVVFWAYYADNWRVVGEDTTAPYRFRWSVPASIPEQAVWVSTHVFDNAGNETVDPGGYRYFINQPRKRFFLPVVIHR